MTAATSPRSVIVWQANVESKVPHVRPASPLFRVRVLGELIDQTEDTLIPLTWVGQAVNRARELIHEEPSASTIAPVRRALYRVQIDPTTSK